MRHLLAPVEPGRFRACVPPGRAAEGDDPAFFRTHQPTTDSPPKDERESDRLGDRIHAVPKQCWFNASRAVLTLSDYAGASYVEVWAVLDSGLMIEHGWVVRDGVLIDPALPAGVDAYFPGLEFRGRREIDHFLSTPRGRKCKRSPFLYAYGWGGGCSPTMRKAQTNASVYATAYYLGRQEPLQAAGLTDATSESGGAR